MDQPPQPTGFSQPPVQPEVVPEPSRMPPPRRRSGWLGRLLLFFLLLGLIGSLAVNVLLAIAVGVSALAESDTEGRVQEKFVSHNSRATDKVAILSIEGTIINGEGFFKHQIDHAKKDIEEGNLKALVVRVDSPGGTITGSDYMLHYLRKLAKDSHIPVVVSMGGIAASGGYYVSMCVGDRPETIFAEPTTWTGSIGVIIPHFNLAELMQKWGIQEDDVASHRLKGMGSITRKMTPEEREIFQALVNEGFTQFKDAIKQGRPKFQKDPTALDKLATGQVFTAQQALQNGLIDQIGFIEDAIDRAIRLAKLDKDKVKVVRYKAESRLSDILFGRAETRPSFDLARLLDSATPRAFYLCTWLPAAARSGKGSGE
jgi:protease IV